MKRYSDMLLTFSFLSIHSQKAHRLEYAARLRKRPPFKMRSWKSSRVSPFGVSQARNVGATPAELLEANEYTLKATFSTLTNVNFSEERIAEYIHQGMALKKQLENLVQTQGWKSSRE